MDRSLQGLPVQGESRRQDAGAGNRVTPTGEGCLISNGGRTAKCSVGNLAVGGVSRVTHRVPAISVQQLSAGSLDGVDPDTTNNSVTFRPRPT